MPPACSFAAIRTLQSYSIHVGFHEIAPPVLQLSSLNSAPHEVMPALGPASAFSNTVIQVLVWCGAIWLILVLSALLITSICPCILRCFRRVSAKPTVVVQECSAEDEKNGNFVGRLIQSALELYDFKKAIGVAVDVGSITVRISSGVVELRDIVVDSPDGYYAPLLKISKVLIDLDLQALIYSAGADVILVRTSIEGFELTVEKSITTSNLNDILRFLSARNQDDVRTTPPEEPEAEKTKSSASWLGEWWSGHVEKSKQKAKRTMTLREVSLKDTGAQFSFYCCAGGGVLISAGDLHYDDFDTEMCKDLGTTTVPFDIIPFITMTLLRTIVENLMSKGVAVAVEDEVRDACDAVIHSATLVNRTLSKEVLQFKKRASQVGTSLTKPSQK